MNRIYSLRKTFSISTFKFWAFKDFKWDENCTQFQFQFQQASEWDWFCFVFDSSVSQYYWYYCLKHFQSGPLPTALLKFGQSVLYLSSPKFIYIYLLLYGSISFILFICEVIMIFFPFLIRIIVFIFHKPMFPFFFFFSSLGRDTLSHNYED